MLGYSIATLGKRLWLNQGMLSCCRARETVLTDQDAGKEADRGADKEKRDVPGENIESRRPQVLFLNRTAETIAGN